MPAARPADSAAKSVSGYYWQQSRRPLASLLMVLPLLIAYETGLLVLGPEAMRNGADIWLRQFLDVLGFSEYFVLPLLTVAVLAGWHYTRCEPWNIRPGVAYAMLAESALLAIVLVVVAQAQGSLLSMMVRPQEQWPIHASLFHSLTTYSAQIVSFIGAGVYEEVLFRLVLLSGLLYGMRLIGATPVQAAVFAILTSAVLFSAAHYIGPHGYQLDWFTFSFRTIAGTFFGTLFVYRGFGIAAATHAGYDILVGFCC
jgi:membrane protease YdiL (CAAX protease family)